MSNFKILLLHLIKGQFLTCDIFISFSSKCLLIFTAFFFSQIDVSFRSILESGSGKRVRFSYLLTWFALLVLKKSVARFLYPRLQPSSTAIRCCSSSLPLVLSGLGTRMAFPLPLNFGDLIIPSLLTLFTTFLYFFNTFINLLGTYTTLTNIVCYSVFQMNIKSIHNYNS